jgi:nucleoid-associated protein YgaU
MTKNQREEYMWPFGKSTEKRLQDAIKYDATLGKYKLEAKVSKKVAVITGEVPDQGTLETIKSVAQGINGVKSVDTSGVKVANPQETQPTQSLPAAAIPASAETSAKGSSETSPAPSGANVPFATPPADPSARAKAAHQKIRAEASLANNPLDVLQKGTTIVLRGAVDSEAEHAKAKELAASVEGVTGVDVSGLQVIAHASELNVTDDDGDIVYTVKAGDTLSHIALHYYGDAGKTSYMKIAEANGLADANKIQVGQKLKIPGTTKGPEVTA